jgi:asparagine synthase (glutamine-hydrolysing)
MCGIAGIYAYHYAANPLDVAELRAMRDHMAARGPDGCGEWIAQDGRVGFGHRRLAIIDLSEQAAQPMASPDGSAMIAFNGEIYNYKTLRAGLEAKGRVLRTQSDTEVLLHLYALKGAAMVHDLRGMFAFALWDAARGGLLLARDPYGIKPLYYADDGWTLRFASQVKALIAGGRIGLDPDPAGWAGFFLFGSVPEPYTVHRAVRAVEAGTTLWIDRCGPGRPTRYFAVSGPFAAAPKEQKKPTRVPSAGARERIRVALLDSVRHHLVADVPVGIFLSSGVDSAALLGLMRDAGQRDVEAITLRYDEFRGRSDDEAPLAALTARHYGARHTIRTVTREEFRADLPKIFAAMDQPTIDGINTWFVAKAARERGLKAALSGLGGDELVGGYPSFSDIPRWVRLTWLGSIVPFLSAMVRHAIVALNGMMPLIHPKAAGFLQYAGSYSGAYLLRRAVFMPWELSGLMDRDFMREGLRRLDPVKHIAAVLEPEPKGAWSKVAALEAGLYLRNQLLRDTDWASMAHSLEVRVPFVDATLSHAVASDFAGLPAGLGKELIANSPSAAVPPEVQNRAKTGFSTPIAQWLQDDERVRAWCEVPRLRSANCPWARRWAYQIARA